MCRGLCWMLIVALSVCGCSKKSTPPEAVSVPPQAAPVAESNTPAPPNKNEHPVLLTTREFLRAINAGNYGRALSFSIPDEITEQSLKGMHDTPLQWDQATFAQVWVGKEQAAVITNPVPLKDSPITMTWALNLVATDDGQWLVRLTDILKTPEEAEDYVAALRAVAPEVKALELPKD